MVRATSVALSGSTFMASGTSFQFGEIAGHKVVQATDFAGAG